MHTEVTIGLPYTRWTRGNQPSSHPEVFFVTRSCPFGLRNVGATYQQMVTKMFGLLMGSTMDAYIDDMVVKCKEEQNHLKNLAEVFSILRDHKLKLMQLSVPLELAQENSLDT